MRKALGQTGEEDRILASSTYFARAMDMSGRLVALQNYSRIFCAAKHPPIWPPCASRSQCYDLARHECVPTAILVYYCFTAYLFQSHERKTDEVG